MPLDHAAPVISMRPTVRIDGMELPLLAAAIERLRVVERLGGHATMELTLRDTLSFGDGSVGYGATASSPLRLGAAITLYAGDTTGPREIFDGVITALEAEAGPHTTPLFTVLADDRLWRARKSRRSRTFEAASPADIVRAIAADHGLTAEVRDGLDAPLAARAQVNESDLAFLRRVLAGIDADVHVVGRALQAGPCARDARTRRDLQLGATLLRARFTADLADQATETRAGGFDPETGEAVIGTATAGEMGPGRGRAGPELLRGVMETCRDHAGHQGPLSAAEASALARALYGRRARRFVRVDATAQGDPSLRVGSHVAVTGVNPLFENTYAVTEATHRFDRDNGYLTDLIAEGAYLGGAP